MKRRSWLWLLVVLVLVQIFPVASSAEAQQEKSIGTVTALEGTATVQHDGDATPRPLRVQSPVYQRDVIRTEAASKLQVTFADATVVNLSENSTLEITRFVYSPEKQAQTTIFNIPLGIFRTIVKTLSPQSSFEITTPTTIAAIRGTDLMGEVKPEATALVVLEGTVALFSVRRIFRGIVTLTEGLGSTISGDRPPSAPTKWSQERIEALRRATTVR